MWQSTEIYQKTAFLTFLPVKLLIFEGTFSGDGLEKKFHHFLYFFPDIWGCFGIPTTEKGVELDPSFEKFENPNTAAS